MPRNFFPRFPSPRGAFVTSRLGTSLRRAGLLAMHPHWAWRRTRHVFILSHMRSRSSLLAHILGSHPDIVGYRELLIAYTSRRGLLAQRAELFGEFPHAPSNPWLLDKILHETYALAPGVLRPVDPSLLFLVREPRGTLDSLLRMYAKHAPAVDHPRQRALEHYTHRLGSLVRDAQRLPGRKRLLLSDELLARPAGVLEELTGWLGLSEPLSPEYRQFRHSGQPLYGDTSSKLASNRIVVTEPASSEPLPGALLEKAEGAFRKCLAELRDRLGEGPDGQPG